MSKNSKSDYFIAIDLGGTSTKLGIVSSDGLVIAKTSFDTQKNSSPKLWSSCVKQNVNNLLKKTGVLYKQLRGCGVGVPGLVNFNKGLVYNLTNVKGWKNIFIAKILSKELDVPTYADNDVNVAAIGEYVFGRGSTFENVVFIALGTGVGGGLILNGHLFRGNAFSAGEIGHMLIHDKGAKCNCGLNGCLESFVGNGYIVKQVVQQLKKGQKSSLQKMVKGDYSQLTPFHIYQAAKAKDKYALQVWSQVAGHLARMLIGVVNLLNPDAIIIGGGVGSAYSLFAPTLKTLIKNNAMDIPAKHVKVVSAKLKKDAGLIGAAALFLESNKK